MEREIIALVTESADVLLAYALDLVAVVLLLIGGWIVAGWARRAVLRAVDRSPRLDRTIGLVLGNVARYTVLIFVLVAVLAQFGVQTASIIAALGAAGIAVGLALQGTLSNVAAGIMLLALRPFTIGEYVDADGIAGTIEEIGLLTTRMTTFDGIYRVVPNSNLWNRTITNYSRNPTRRLDLVVGIAYGDDPDAAMKALHEMAQGDQRVLDDPAPQTMVSALGDSAVNVNLRVWTRTEDYWDALWDLTREAKRRIEGAGLSIPFPQRDIHVHHHGGDASGA